MVRNEKLYFIMNFIKPLFVISILLLSSIGLGQENQVSLYKIEIIESQIKTVKQFYFVGIEDEYYLGNSFSLLEYSLIPTDTAQHNIEFVNSVDKKTSKLRNKVRNCNSSEEVQMIIDSNRTLVVSKFQLVGEYRILEIQNSIDCNIINTKRALITGKLQKITEVRLSVKELSFMLSLFQEIGNNKCYK